MESFYKISNFLSNSCNLCIELNAHNLIKLVHQFRRNPDILRVDMFQTTAFSSHMFERFFRSARSRTSTYSTIINFNIKEFMQIRTERIQSVNSTITDIGGTFFPEKSGSSC